MLQQHMRGAGIAIRAGKASRLAPVLFGLCVGLPLFPLLAGAADPVVEGFRHLEAGHPKKALALFERALSRNPASPELLTYAGLGHFKNQHYPEALEAFDQARSREPNIVDSAFLFYRASTLRALGLGVMEREAWGEVIAFDPHSRFARQARLAREEQGKQERHATRDLVDNGLLHWDDRPMVAAAYFREALARGPDAGAARVQTYLAAVLNQSGQYRAVVELGQRYTPPPGQRAEWDIQMAAAQMGLREWERATQVLSRVPPGSEWHRKVQYMQALCLVRLDRGDQAETVLQDLSPEAIPGMENELRALQEALGSSKSAARDPL